MINRKELLKMLNEKKIKFEIFFHPPLFTVEESKKFRGKIKGAHTKNLFLKNKKNQFFLFSCLESSKIEFKKIKQTINIGNVSFASAEYLKKMMNLLPGSVSPFGLLNDENDEIVFYFDKKLTEFEKINFHPLENTATLCMDTKKFLNFMDNNNKPVNIVNFDESKY